MRHNCQLIHQDLSLISKKHLQILKNMKKILLAIALLSGAAASSFAQTSGPKDGGKFSIGAEAGLPVGSVSDISNFAVGGSLKYEYPVATNTLVSISAGYTNFLYKSEFKDLTGKSGEGFIPVKAGLKYYFNQGFFGEGQVGAVFATESGGGTAFVYAPGIGYTFKGGFEAGFRYEGWAKNGTVSQLALRLAYRF
jgi:hypothetical protein